ncbi:carnitinyl-CoA dehydratase [Bradyrhizobium cajani]|uniref:Crotonobetainyl-CoA hydratase n=1 Tax=Bradyrhizobium cajani TaxID=1928661 RepID=A0A844TBD3_9BRAD|nr:carnitinyl-CoA dehydratase [Bradyrhizobium cajani]MCP3371776.1 carnitinyl-CoA dehydratase [Bradyrhizobium cajani]MVT76403.1 crotonobetainyl-CoA hydratase [Bradyrhizobium cajani]
MTDIISTRREGSILEVTLNRPKFANAIDWETSRLMSKTFKGFRDDQDLRVAILKSASDKHFCAGWDLKTTAAAEIPGAAPVNKDFGVGGFGGIQELPHLNKPVIACVNGVALGGGFELALSCDLIYASEHSSFGLPEIIAGTLADAASSRLHKRMPWHIAMELLFTGRRMDAAEAHRWGLVNEVLPKEKLEQRVWEVARLLAAGPPLVFAAIKETVRVAEALSFQDTMNRVKRRQIATVDTLYGSDDMLEGSRAFAEKRNPVWKGK